MSLNFVFHFHEFLRFKTQESVEKDSHGAGEHLKDCKNLVDLNLK